MPYILLHHFTDPLQNECGALHYLQSPLPFSALHYLHVSNPLPPDGLTQKLPSPKITLPLRTLTVALHIQTLLVFTNDRND